MTYKGIIFDLDGTLADTLIDIADCANDCATRLGYEGAPVEEYRYMVGNGVRRLAEKLLKTADEAAIIAFIDAFSKELPRYQVRTTDLYPGIREMLDALISRKVQLAILSNKPDHLVPPLLDKLFNGVFDRTPFSIARGQRPELPRKPDPEGVFALCRELGLSKKELLYIGDTATDMQTGTAAGLATVGVLWGFREAGELIDTGARILVARPEEIPQLLNGVPEVQLMATSHLVMRETLLTDLPAIEPFWKDHEANILDHGTIDPGIWRPENVVKLQRTLKKGPCPTMWTMLLPPSLEVIGYVRIRAVAPSAGKGTIAVRLGRTWWGNGYAPEALKTLCPHIAATHRLNSLELEVLAGNKRGLRAYEKAGFSLVREKYRDGRMWTDLQWKRQ